jgi:hypothetical protein
LLADHCIVAVHITSSPDEPLGAVTGDRSVTGPLQVMSKLLVAAPGESAKWNYALGMLK